MPGQHRTPVLRHRIKINYNAVNERLTVDDVIAQLVKEVGGKKHAAAKTEEK